MCQAINESCKTTYVIRTELVYIMYIVYMLSFNRKSNFNFQFFLNTIRNSSKNRCFPCLAFVYIIICAVLPTFLAFMFLIFKQINLNINCSTHSQYHFSPKKYLKKTKFMVDGWYYVRTYIRQKHHNLQ